MTSGQCSFAKARPIRPCIVKSSFQCGRRVIMCSISLKFERLSSMCSTVRLCVEGPVRWRLRTWVAKSLWTPFLMVSLRWPYRCSPSNSGCEYRRDSSGYPCSARGNGRKCDVPNHRARVCSSFDGEQYLRAVLRFVNIYEQAKEHFFPIR